MKPLFTEVINKQKKISFKPNGKLIRELRKERGITQSEMARRIGCTSAHLCDIEGGRRNLGNPVVRMKLERALR